MPTITVLCEGLTEAEGSTAPANILEEFSARPWQLDVQCSWGNGKLMLTARNDHDPAGLALLDEFWDVIHACIHYSGAVRVSIAEVKQ